MKSKKETIRVVGTVENEIVLNAIGRKNGRDAYPYPSMKYLERTVRNKGLDWFFKMPILEEVYETLKKRMEEPGK